MTMSDCTSLDLQIQRLSDIEAIRQLKARYFHGCDQKQLSVIKHCFADGDIFIDYGVIGQFHHRDEFLALFSEKACHAHIVDTHHGQNAQIDCLSSDKATAIWDLYFFQIDTQAKTLTQLAGFYEDEFIKVAGHWFIQKTSFTVTSSVITRMQEENANILFAGNPSLAS